MIKIAEIEWHDLPIKSISFADDGFELVVTPWSEARDDYDCYKLKLTKFERLSVDIKSVLTCQDITSLEVSKFDYKIDNDLLTGEFGILPANTGYWTISFSNAIWDFSENA
jgi:hypothetical protein